MFWLAVWWSLALLSLKRWRRVSTAMLWAGLFMLGFLGFVAVPDALLRQLESRYPIPNAQGVDKHVGMIVLGGAIGRPEIFKARGQVTLSDAAERMIEPVAIMRNYPKLKLVFTGGEGRLLATGVSEGGLAKVFYEQQGVDMSRVSFESGSRTTRENAHQVAKLLGDKCKQPWLLVTSAWHMPRSMDEFKAVGCNVTAYPVDFWTSNNWGWTDYSLAHSLVHWQTALHEWLGIWAYRLTR